MNLFGAIPIAATGIDTAQTWLSVTAGNVANMNDQVSGSATPYEEQFVIASPEGDSATQIGQGVNTTVVAGHSPGIEIQDRGNPIANAQGFIREPDIDLGSQLVNVIQAQEAYQSNVDIVNQSKTAYQSALTITT